MPTDGPPIFTDRELEVALFQKLRGRDDPTKPWPLLPILTFIGPGGSGKSTLIKHLIEKCRKPDGRPAVPFAYLNFRAPDAPPALLLILVELRRQLQQCTDGREHLAFPRFDLGALVARAPTEDLSAFTPSKVLRKLSPIKQTSLDSLAAVGDTLGFLVPYLPAVLAEINLVTKIPAVQDTMQRVLARLTHSTDWNWYRTELGLGDRAGMEDVLLRLYELSQRGPLERDQRSINELLPAAFVADIYHALVETNPPKAWSPTDNVVIFLDGFEDLQAGYSTATSLLQGLTTNQRSRGGTDPLLLVIGSRIPPVGMTEDQQPDAFQRTELADEITVERRIDGLYAQWRQRLPTTRQGLQQLGLADLVLRPRLHDFRLDHVDRYLRDVGKHEETEVFTANDLVQPISDVTRGQPLFLAVAAAAVLEAEDRGRKLLPADFQWIVRQVEKEKASRAISAEHEGELIGDHLLKLFLGNWMTPKAPRSVVLIPLGRERGEERDASHRSRIAPARAARQGGTVERLCADPHTVAGALQLGRGE